MDTQTRRRVARVLLSAANVISAKEEERAVPGSKFSEIKGQKLTLQELLDRGITIREGLGHLKPSKIPAPDIPKDKIVIDLTGDLNSHALMLWKDPKGRDQRAYTPEFHQRHAAKKWERVKSLDTSFDDAKQKLLAMVKSAGTPTRTRDAAAILAIIAYTGLRPGGTGHLHKSGNRGISTLAVENVKISGSRIKLKFVGKSTKENNAEFEDRVLAAYLAERMEGKSKGDFLFEAHDKDLPPIMSKVGLGRFKPKDLRTLLATRKGAEALATLKGPPPPLPEDENKALKLIKQKIKEASQKVADFIGNTAAVAQKSYLSPAVIQSWIQSIGGTPNMVPAGVMVVPASAAKAPTAEEIWQRAKQVTLPGHDEQVTDVPENLPDEEADSDALPEELKPKPKEDMAPVAAALRLAAHTLLKGTE